MATSAIAALLDELMGRTRNFDPNEKPPDLHWEDDTVCKYFLCGFCPHELFTNTRADLGNCSKIHDDALRKRYQESSRFEKMGYEEEFLLCLQTLISDVDRRIRRGHQRLALNNSQNTLTGGALAEKEEKINVLTEKINTLVNQAEELGCEGKVEEAQGVLKLCDQLREECIQVQNHSVKDDLSQFKQMEVCMVCGAFLVIDDAPQRQDEHIMGKQHAGYARVRSEIEKRKMQKKMKLDEREQKRRQDLEEQEKALEKECEGSCRRERQDRDYERGRYQDKKQRSRSRSHGRRRSRSHGRRSRERHRSGSHERRRSKDRKQRSQSRSDRSKSSKSSHHSRSHSRDRGKSSNRRDRDRTQSPTFLEKPNRDRHSRSQSRDRDREKGHSSSAEKARKIPAGRSDEGNSQSQGDTKTD